MVHLRWLGVLILTALVGMSTGLPAQSTGNREKVLIRAVKPYTQVVARVRALGGTVTYQYKYIDAIAAEIPVGALGALRDLLGTAAVSKDEEVPMPRSIDTSRGRNGPGVASPTDVIADSVDTLDAGQIAALAQANPQAYLINDTLGGLNPLFAAGKTGNGIIVAVIDSGIRPGFPHISLDGSVTHCDDFVGDNLGCLNSSNNPHGTFVAGMISANVVFGFSPASTFRQAVLAECPSCFDDPPANTRIPMIGTAPQSSIYALRVFGATGGAPTSRILAAMERVIDLRAQDPPVVIKVVNMSLGGATIFAGRDLEDQMVNALLDHDIVPVIAAGNAGPSSLTVGSPGSAIGALTVGAASLAHNERILERLQYGPVVGALYRPFTGHQTAFFSSRGPNADGRPDPDVVMNGFASFGQGYGSTNSISFGSGTSFATPSVSGVAAVLREAFPNATARQIRNAIIAGADPQVLSDDSTVLDEGAGYVNATKARDLLAAGLVPDTLPAGSHFTKNVNVNIQQNTFLRVLNGSVFESASLLKPGERHEIVYNVTPNTKQVFVSLLNVTPALESSEQNQLFGDDILLSIHSAKTSSIGEGDYKAFEFTTGGTFVINNPEPGLMRITVNGDWTNAGPISADVAIFSTTEAIPQLSAQSKLADLQVMVFPLNVPPGVSNADFRLAWREDWGTYPSADFDLILISPTGEVNVDGATLNNPEVATVANPRTGTWTVLVDGFSIPTGSDKFELRVSLDGKVQKIW